VINWGEGIYYADGINVINPVDIGRVVLPNASLKDALLPTNMISGQLGLTDAFNIEAFYGLEWKGHELIPTGAFLNNQDYFGKGSNGVLVDLRSELGDLAELVPGLNGENGIVAGARYGREHDARDDGQFGVAMRYLAEDWNNTEFSLYYLNYHSKVPFLRIQKGRSLACSTGQRRAVQRALRLRARLHGRWPGPARQYLLRLRLPRGHPPVRPQRVRHRGRHQPGRRADLPAQCAARAVDDL